MRGSKAHAWLYRTTGGHVLGRMGGRPILLLTTTGRRSGLARCTPLEYQPIGSDLVVVASNRGAPVEPAWYRNLVANRDVRVRIGTEEFDCRARVTTGADRDDMWAVLTENNPWLVRAAKSARRLLPVVVLERG